ncbi:FAD-dependent monooxygenase [Flavobacterium sp. AC]|uniref:FAD-dependent monooxygenase n=1 Tax=Flavobacterium azizsancarii TaxID=2961580 RepID=A0ABT4WBG4_9FLAO|nr:FAD-dependent monooxygenase [Flavobacterium azizsancarii]MDA6069918.1 FAD-dependent monooxygenase [Flavobacterium azizsancarii]
METLKNKKVLVSGASFAGLSTAYWMNKFGCKVTIVEVADDLKMGGTPVDILGNTVDIAKRMGIFEQIKSNRLNPRIIEFKNADNITEGFMAHDDDEQIDDDESEIERDILLKILYNTIKNDVEFVFNDSITALNETNEEVKVTFKNNPQKKFDFVFGCDGIHSAVRRLWFGPETDYVHFLQQYFSITIVDKLLIKEDSAQLYNVPNKAVMLNTYNNKTDIILCFRSEKEIPYDYRNEDEQRNIILEKFAGESWRTSELLQEVQNSKTFYFDKFCQIKMPSWTKGRIALVGDAAYCASPAAGMGGSLAINGAASLADAFEKHDGNFEEAFKEYNISFRPFIEEVQANAVNFGLEILIPRTEEAIRTRNAEAKQL